MGTWIYKWDEPQNIGPYKKEKRVVKQATLKNSKDDFCEISFKEEFESQVILQKSNERFKWLTDGWGYKGECEIVQRNRHVLGRKRKYANEIYKITRTIRKKKKTVTVTSQWRPMQTSGKVIMFGSVIKLLWIQLS